MTTVACGPISVPAMPGIYEIVHLASGRCYVGSAVNLRRRWAAHQRSMLRGVGGNTKLRHAWSKYGPAAFVFRVVVLCERAELLRVEEAVIRMRNAVADGFNCRSKPDSNLGLRLPCSAETRLKIGRANARALKGRPGPMVGKRHSGASRAKMSVAAKARAQKIEYLGRSMSIRDWAAEIGVSPWGLSRRLSKGWPLQRALAGRQP